MWTWMLLVYKVPKKPTANRVYVWRKLKRLGALLLHDSVWVLPATPFTREQLRWLAAEIGELKGEASVWESQLVMGTDEDTLVRQFNSEVEGAYRTILAALRKSGADLAALSRQYQQVQVQDYFGSELGRMVRGALIKAQGGSR